MKKETAIYPSLRKLLGTTLAAAIMTALSCLLVIAQPHGKVGLVIGIVGAVFFGGCICILFIVLLKNFFRNIIAKFICTDCKIQMCIFS